MRVLLGGMMRGGFGVFFSVTDPTISETLETRENKGRAAVGQVRARVQCEPFIGWFKNGGAIEGAS